MSAAMRMAVVMKARNTATVRMAARKPSRSAARRYPGRR
jgi:hypothetical protein